MKASHPTMLMCTAAFLFAAFIPVGGGTDLTARLLAEQLNKILGQR